MYLDYSIDYKVGNKECTIDVEFEAYPCWENDGIGFYEYWGLQEYDKGHDFVSLETHGFPTWDISKHTKVENEVIQSFLDSDKYIELDDLFCKKYEESFK